MTALAGAGVVVNGNRGRLSGLAGWVRGLRGWRRLGLALGAGASAALALAPFNFPPVLFVAFPVLLWLLEGTQDLRRAFVVGWAFGLGFFMAGLYWTGLSMLVDAGRFAIFLPFAIVGLPAALAIYCGLTGVAWRWLGLGGVWGAIALAVFWVAAEYLRGLLFTGFPWNLIGYTWTAADVAMQPAAYIGVYGLGLLTVATAAMPGALAGRDLRRFRGWAPPIAMLGICAAVFAGGALRLAGAVTANVEGVFLRIVQANVPQSEKWRPNLREKHFARQVALSRGPGWERVTHVIWPETAAPFFIESDTARRRLMLPAVPPGGALLTGTLRRTSPSVPTLRLWNSLVAIDRQGRILDSYDKEHLVPFGEYLPFRPLLSAIGFGKLTQGSIDYSAGRDGRPRSVAGLPPYRPLICYEVIFPNEIVGAGGVRPKWLLNITNDAWFGDSSGPYQHFAMARMRAVEQGVPLVRAANTGISAIVDPFGRVVARLGIGQTGVLDGALPAALSEATPYVRWGDLPFGITIVLMISALLFKKYRRIN